MDADLDTLLIALYVELTDRIIPSLGFTRPPVGGVPETTDAELVGLAVAQAHLGYVKERRWLRAAPARVGHLFPHIPSQPRYNTRLPGLSPLMLATMTYLAEHTDAYQDAVRLMDSTKIICGMSRETVKHTDLFGYCGYGYDASHTLYFWGMRLLPPPMSRYAGYPLEERPQASTRIIHIHSDLEKPETSPRPTPSSAARAKIMNPGSRVDRAFTLLRAEPDRSFTSTKLAQTLILLTSIVGQ
jgi:hypothetical protein